MGRNVNDLGYGKCPGCNSWGELKRYHPEHSHIPRKKKDKYCTKCVQNAIDSKVPFHRIKKAIANHKTQAKEGDYSFKDLMVMHKQQGCMCAYCGSGIPYEFSLEHMIPRKYGGRNLLVNICLVCPICNSAKQHLEPFFFLRRKGYILRERILIRLKGAYDYHDYECNATCKDCRGQHKGPDNALCKSCPIDFDSALKTACG